MTIQKQQKPSAKRHKTLAVVLAGLVSGLAGSMPLFGNAVQVLDEGDDLQAAIDAAQPGDVIRLKPGAEFTGNFVLPAHDGAPITIRTATPDERLPAGEARIGLEHAPLLATLRQAVPAPVLKTAPGARGWRLIGLRLLGNGSGDIVTIGDGSDAQRDYADVPGDMVLDRLLILGDPVRGQKRGIALNSGSTTITNSHIAGVRAVGQETQAIAGWNGPGPYVIENNYIEAAGIGVLFGGAEPSIGGLVPGDISIRRNTFARPAAWRSSNWTVKNLLELKNARRVTIEGNLFERNWSAAQVGYAILFTVRSSGPRAPWSVVEDVTFQNNIVRDVAAGINILGLDTVGRSQQAHGILIRNNLFYDVDHTKWGGNGTFLQIGEEARDVVVERNTVLQTGNLVTVYGGTKANPRPVRGFEFRNNIGRHNQYGIFGNGVGVGAAAIATYFPDGNVTGNVLAGGQASRYPSGNLFPSLDELMAQFADPAAHDYRLLPATPLDRSGLPGGPVGVDYDELTRAMTGRR